jgi:hypothetical protein
MRQSEIASKLAGVPLLHLFCGLLAEQALLDKLSEAFRTKTDPTKLW